MELERPSSALVLRGCGVRLPITGDPGKWSAARRESGGGSSSDDGRDNITRSERRTPASPMYEERSPRSRPVSERLNEPTGVDGTEATTEPGHGSGTSPHNEGISNLQALQRVLSRSAKQEPTRRFHALHDKLTRSDVMWQAWVNVATNQGAPGIDGVSIDSIEAGGMEGVRSFLDSLAAEVKANNYRPQPLRRVNIPKAGKPGETRPLGIPALRDRVLMSAAKLILEPIFEADF